VITITLESKDGLYEAVLFTDASNATDYQSGIDLGAFDYELDGERHAPGVGRHPTRTGAISNAFLSFKQMNGREAE